jgi:Ca2+-binding EF-hand superfamily protein
MMRGAFDQLADFTYSIYDINGDGSLTREELHTCLKGSIFAGYGVDEDDVEECERELIEIVMKK